MHLNGINLISSIKQKLRNFLNVVVYMSVCVDLYIYLLFYFYLFYFSETLFTDFFSKKSLNERRKMHQCSFCPYSTDHKSHWTCHLRKHTGEKPYICNICFKPFTQKSTLKTHARVHSGGKPYTCPICFETFNYKTTLDAHVVSHKPL